MTTLAIIISFLLCVVGFVTMLKAGYAAEDDFVWHERDYIGIWILSIVWPLSLVIGS